jgi:uncharacterized membrane protein
VSRPPILRTGLAETARLEAFSDGVLAIVITLLVLEVQLPATAPTEAALWHELYRILPRVLAWIVSFAFILVFWVAHHYFFQGLQRIDRGVMWLNGLFLLFISLTPFPTGLVGAYPMLRPPMIVLSGVMFLTASSFSLLRWYATHHAGLFAPDAVAHARRAYRRSLIAPALYLGGFAAGFVSVYPSLAVQILVPVLFFFPPRAAPMPSP